MFILLYPRADGVAGMSLPLCQTCLPNLTIPQGTALGCLTGQKQTDGLGNVTRIEVLLKTPLPCLMVRFGKNCLTDKQLVTQWFKNRPQPLKIWVKPNMITHED